MLPPRRMGSRALLGDGDVDDEEALFGPRRGAGRRSRAIPQSDDEAEIDREARLAQDDEELDHLMNGDTHSEASVFAAAAGEVATPSEDDESVQDEGSEAQAEEEVVRVKPRNEGEQVEERKGSMFFTTEARTEDLSLMCGFGRLAKSPLFSQHESKGGWISWMKALQMDKKHKKRNGDDMVGDDMETGEGDAGEEDDEEDDQGDRGGFIDVENIDAGREVDAERAQRDLMTGGGGRPGVADDASSKHSESSTDTWSCRRHILKYTQPMIPVRTMVVNIPISCFSNDATGFKDFATPRDGSVRVASIAALLGLLCAPYSKGFMSGNHSETTVQRKREEENAEQEGDKDAPKPKVKRVHRYMVEGEDGELHPMVTWGVEELYNQDKRILLAMRVWLFVFDESHSVSHMIRKVMAESEDENNANKMGHCQNSMRRQNIAHQSVKTRQVAGLSLDTAVLEDHAGGVYRHISTEHDLLGVYKAYANKTEDCEGRCPIDFDGLPHGSLNARIGSDQRFGGSHVLSPEFVLNAQRPAAMAAGLVDGNGDFLDVNPQQLDPSSYFHRLHDNGPESGRFVPPPWLFDSDDSLVAFFLQTDPSRLNLFDMAIPTPVSGGAVPGDALLTLYNETYNPGRPMNRAQVIRGFNRIATSTSSSVNDAIAFMRNTVLDWGSSDASQEEKRKIKEMRRMCQNGMSAYGASGDGGQMSGIVIQPRECLVEISHLSCKIYSKLIAPFASNERKRLKELKHKENQSCDPDAIHTAAEEKRAFEERHVVLMDELIEYQLNKIQRAFLSKSDSEAMPPGYNSIWQGLFNELESCQDNSACIAFSLGSPNATTDSTKTVFGRMVQWIGEYYENDLLIEGRDWRLCYEVLFCAYEILTDETFLLLIAGSKGGGKSQRLKRIQAALVPGWVTASGSSSEKADKQGQQDADAGSLKYYDELPSDLGQADAGAIENWKSKLLERKLVYQKAMPARGSDGLETHRSVKLVTPHRSSHCVLTNEGILFAHGSSGRPSSSKEALLDRCILTNVRTIKTRNHTGTELEEHFSHPEAGRRMRIFRVLTCLAALLRMLIFRCPHLRPDTAYAQRCFDLFDERLYKNYGLPKPTSRRNGKRLENLVTLCCLHAAYTVFCNAQTAANFAMSAPNEQYPNGQPFDIRQLKQCIALLVPTPEMISFAWSFGLEYSMTTSMLGTTALTVLSECAGREISDFFFGELASQEETLPSSQMASNLEIMSEVMQAFRSTKEKAETGNISRDGAFYQRAAEDRAHHLARYAAACKEKELSLFGDELIRQRLEVMQRLHNSPKLHSDAALKAAVFRLETRRKTRIQNMRVTKASTAPTNPTDKHELFFGSGSVTPSGTVDYLGLPNTDVVERTQSKPNHASETLVELDDSMVDFIGMDHGVEAIPQFQRARAYFSLDTLAGHVMEHSGLSIDRLMKDASATFKLALCTQPRMECKTCVFTHSIEEAAMCPICCMKDSEFMSRTITQLMPSMADHLFFSGFDGLNETIQGNLNTANRRALGFVCAGRGHRPFPDYFTLWGEQNEQANAPPARAMAAPGEGVETGDSVQVQSMKDKLVGEKVTTFDKDNRLGPPMLNFAGTVDQFARSLLSNRCATALTHDVYTELMRDCLYVLSQSDNTRILGAYTTMSSGRLTPSVRSGGNVLNAKYVYNKELYGLSDLCPVRQEVQPDGGVLAGVASVQRVFDAFYLSGVAHGPDAVMCTPATIANPISVLTDKIRINIGLLHQHLAFTAEACAFTSVIPGLCDCGEDLRVDTSLDGFWAQPEVEEDGRRGYSGVHSGTLMTLSLRYPCPIHESVVCVDLFNALDVDLRGTRLEQTLKDATKWLETRETFVTRLQKSELFRLCPPLEKLASLPQDLKKKIAEGEGELGALFFGYIQEKSQEIGAHPPRQGYRLRYQSDAFGIAVTRKLCTFYQDSMDTHDPYAVLFDTHEVRLQEWYKSQRQLNDGDAIEDALNVSSERIKERLLPEVTTRFAGNNSLNRALLSFPQTLVREGDFTSAFDVDETIREEQVIAKLSSLLGHQPTPGQVDTHLRLLHGNRLMPGVRRSDHLLAYSTFMSTAAATLKTRGLVRDGDIGLDILLDAQLCVLSREYELNNSKGVALSTPQSYFSHDRRERYRVRQLQEAERRAAEEAKKAPTRKRAMSELNIEKSLLEEPDEGGQEFLSKRFRSRR